MREKIDKLLPCPICGGVEGCDHSVMERARAYEANHRGGKINASATLPLDDTTKH